VPPKRTEDDPSTQYDPTHVEIDATAPSGAAPPEFPDGSWAEFVAARSRFLRSRGMVGDEGDDPPRARPHMRAVRVSSHFLL